MHSITIDRTTFMDMLVKGYRLRMAHYSCFYDPADRYHFKTYRGNGNAVRHYKCTNLEHGGVDHIQGLWWRFDPTAEVTIERSPYTYRRSPCK